jgi:hypothetical protein
MKAIGGLAVRHRRCNHGDRTDPSLYNVANADRGHDGKQTDEAAPYTYSDPDAC